MELLWILVALYFLPSIVGILRRKNNLGAIITLNILLGWTFIGWVISAVWAMTDVKKT